MNSITATPPTAATGSQPVDILLVEDSPKDIKLAMRAFSRHNLQNAVHVARDGAEALETLMGDVDRSEALPKLVLLDLKLPKVDGIEVLRRIRAHPKLHQIPVVLLTTSSQSRDIDQAYELGCNGYIVKPVDFQQFSAAIHTLGLYWLVVNTPPAASASQGGSR